MTPQQHAQLLRELANYLITPDIERGTIPDRSRCLAIRARLAAEGIEGRGQDQQQPRPPLWRVMADAYDDAFSESIRNAAAAEICAVADAIPEDFYGANGIKVWLRSEAKRAEEGE